MTDLAAPISLAGSTLRDTPRHVCAFFASDEEEYRVLLPFIRDGFDHGHRAVHVVDPAQRGDHLGRLAAAGIDTAAAEGCGQLELRGSTETYLPDGRFDPERMLGVFEQLTVHRGGFPLSRIVCRMDWAAEGGVVAEEVIEFEARVNHLWCRHDDAVICTYRVGQLGGDALIGIVRTHPLVIVGGILQRNPFFVPPERFLAERRERRAER